MAQYIPAFGGSTIELLLRSLALSVCEVSFSQFDTHLMRLFSSFAALIWLRSNRVINFSGGGAV